MTGVGEGAGTTAKVLEVLKDLPLWLLSGLAVSAVLLLIPIFAVSLPSVARPWIIVGGVVCAVLALARAIGVLIEKIPAWKTAADARQGST